jgi:predicted TIM-barrel enzyme
MIPMLVPTLMMTQLANPPLPPVPVLKNAKKLNLTEEQIKTLTDIQKKYGKELADRRMALVMSSMNFHNEVQAVLTADQKAKAKKLRIQ